MDPSSANAAAKRDEIANPFGYTLFDKLSTRALRRVGVVDVGSNSVRMVVFDGAARSPAYFFNEKVMCALGAGMSETGRLNPEGRVRAINALRRFAHLARAMETGPLICVATAAVREATDGADFQREVREQTGLSLWVVDGREEARLSAEGVFLGWPGAYGLVCDIGGSSMELAEIKGGSVGRRISLQLGPLKLRDIKGGKKARRAYITDMLAAMPDELGEQRDRLFLVGGSWRAIARIDMERRGYPLHVLHEYRMRASSVRDTLAYVQACEDTEGLRRRAGVSAARMALVPHAAEVLREVVRTFKPHDIAISSYGIREGVLYEQMPQELRDRDPLLEACHFTESKNARVPGFGKVLYKFIMPLFKSARPERIRLIRAACLLHDVNWRAHPDYRADICFDTATHVNLGGLKHSERIFLGLALLYRYANSMGQTRFDQVAHLIDDNLRRDAEILGKAMRFGAMLSPHPNRVPGLLHLFPKKKVLELTLAPEASALYGEVVEVRFASLAASLGVTPTVKYAKR